MIDRKDLFMLVDDSGLDYIIGTQHSGSTRVKRLPEAVIRQHSRTMNEWL